jgi:hypothetical protein
VIIIIKPPLDIPESWVNYTIKQDMRISFLAYAKRQFKNFPSAALCDKTRTELAELNK